MKQDKDIKKLIESYLEGSLSEAEKKSLDAWIAQSDNNRLLFERLTNPQYLTDELQKLYSYSQEQGWRRIEEHLQKAEPIELNKEDNNTEQLRKFNWPPWVAAACLMGIIFLGISTFFTTGQINSIPVAVVKKDVAAPVVTKAVIQLANGQMVSLDSINQGMIAQIGNMQVMKNSKGEIIYTGTTDKEIFNTVINPRGSRVISLLLQDGTKVWLNSESSLRYPIAFIGKERKVEIVGEAYFEVAKDPAKKFIVAGNGIGTEVLGTHFNINTYEDESETRVTLVEGKVKVVKGSLTGILKPGQQAAFSNSNQQFSINDVDVNKIIAWQTGVFNFEDDDLPAIMRQLSRWYDVQVKFTGKISNDTYAGIMSRDLSLFNVLKILKITGVKYSLEGKTIKIENN